MTADHPLPARDELTPEPQPPTRSRFVLLLVFLCSLAVAIGWQCYEGAYQSEFGGHPDEAGHYVTGLMIRDYIASGFHGNPMTYAQSYYAHYPKIALGVWPPVFYVVQSAWTLPFSVSRASLMALMAVLAAAVATLIYDALDEEIGGAAALGAGLVWLSLPLVREYYGMVMAEMLSAIFMFGAALRFGRFLDYEKAADILWFGVLAGLAIMTKGTGVALALMAGLALAASGRWRLLLRPSLWGGALLTAVIAGPWTWKFKDAGLGGWEQPKPSLDWSREAAIYYAGKLGLALGVVFVALALLGAIVLWRRKTARRGFWFAAASLVTAVYVFQTIMPVGKEARHLIPALPAALLFAATGIGAVAEWLGRLAQPARKNQPRSTALATALRSGAGATALVTLAGVLAASIQVKNQRCGGFAHLAERYEHDFTPDQPALITSDAAGEGMFIAEVAMHDPHRPSRTVLRGSKELASSQWSGRDYKTKFEAPKDVIQFLKLAKVAAVVVDDSAPASKRQPHQALLSKALAEDTLSYRSALESPIVRGGVVQGGAAHLFEVGAGRSDSAPAAAKAE